MITCLRVPRLHTAQQILPLRLPQATTIYQQYLHRTWVESFYYTTVTSEKSKQKTRQHSSSLLSPKTGVRSSLLLLITLGCSGCPQEHRSPCRHVQEHSLPVPSAAMPVLSSQQINKEATPTIKVSNIYNL